MWQSLKGSFTRLFIHACMHPFIPQHWVPVDGGCSHAAASWLEDRLSSGEAGGSTGSSRVSGPRWT